MPVDTSISRMQKDRKDSYNPIKSTEERRQDLLLLVEVAEKTEKDSYLNELLHNRCWEEGIRGKKFFGAWRGHKNSVAERYDEQQYSEEWRLWKAQTLLWDQFCEFQWNFMRHHC
jgi:hypothetical protein